VIGIAGADRGIWGFGISLALKHIYEPRRACFRALARSPNTAAEGIYSLVIEQLDF